MDVKKTIETINTVLGNITEFAVAVNDAAGTSAEALRDLVENVTFIPAQLRAWDVEEFIELPAALKEKGFGDHAIVQLTELYLADRRSNVESTQALLSHAILGVQGALEKIGLDPAALVAVASAFIPKASAAVPGPVEEPTLEEYLEELTMRAEEGDPIAIELLKRYNEMTKPAPVATEETATTVDQGAPFDEEQHNG